MVYCEIDSTSLLQLQVVVNASIVVYYCTHGVEFIFRLLSLMLFKPYTPCGYGDVSSSFRPRAGSNLIHSFSWSTLSSTYLAYYCGKTAVSLIVTRPSHVDFKAAIIAIGYGKSCLLRLLLISFNLSCSMFRHRHQ